MLHRESLGIQHRDGFYWKGLGFGFSFYVIKYHRKLLCISIYLSVRLPLSTHLKSGWCHAWVLHGLEGCAVVSLSIHVGISRTEWGLRELAAQRGCINSGCAGETCGGGH